jgi:hypothetical protein
MEEEWKQDANENGNYSRATLGILQHATDGATARMLLFPRFVLCSDHFVLVFFGMCVFETRVKVPPEAKKKGKKKELGPLFLCTI